MFIERLLNQGNAPVLEQAVRFASQRHKLIAENLANVSTPGYMQKDLSLEKFNAMLRDKVDQRSRQGVASVDFDDFGAEVTNPQANILFHDRSNRSIEQLMTQGAKNALRHNLMAELLRKQFGSIETALKERIA